MRDFGVEIPDDQVGFASTTAGQPVFHRVKSHDGEGRGLSRCGVTLSDVRPKEEIRRHERPCGLCWRGATTTDTPTRRTATVRTPLVAPLSPVGPLGLRVTPDGLLAIESSADQWVVFDPAKPLMLETAGAQAAEQWRTLRTTWPTEPLINSVEIADHFGVDRTLPTKWRRDPAFPIVSATVADRPGWYRELLPAIETWATKRAPEHGRKTQS